MLATFFTGFGVIHVLEHVEPLIKRDDQRIGGGNQRGDAVVMHHGFGFFHKGAKHPIPNNEDSGIVAVHEFGIPVVMDAMMGGRVENQLQDSHLLHHFRMDKKLIGQAQSDHDQHRFGVKPNQGQRQPKQKHPREVVRQTLTEGHGEIHVLRTVVRHVRGPHDPYRVTAAVKPVIEEILQNEQEEESAQGIGNGKDPKIIKEEIQPRQYQSGDNKKRR